MKKKTDLRVLKTRKLLYEALLNLMEKNEFESITIQQLADEAMINRATFYLHYVDKYELLNASITDKLDELMMKHISPIRHVYDGVVYIDVFREIATEICQTVNDNERFFRIMLNSNSDRIIKDYFSQLIKKNIEPQFKQMFGKEPKQFERHKDIFIQLIVSSIIGVMTWWISSDDREPPEVIASTIINFVTKGPAYVMGLEMGKS